MNASEKAKLLSIFKQHAYGSHNARNKNTFTWMLWNTKEPSTAQERNFRLMVEELVVQDGEPICSHPDFGYWYAASLNDGDPAIADGRSRVAKINERVNKLEKNLIQKYGGQLGMGI